MGKIVKDRIIYGGTPYLSAETGDVLSVDENGNVVGVDPDTLDTKVTQTQDDSTNGFYEVLIAGSTSNTTATEGVKKSCKVRYNPDTATLVLAHPQLSGNITGSCSIVTGSFISCTSHNSLVQGGYTTASGDTALARGAYATASGDHSFAQGDFVTANHRNQFVFGEYNILDDSSAEANQRGNYIEIIGNGTSTSERSNARTLDWNGNEVLSGKLTVGTAPTNNMDVATKQYADSKVDKSGDTMTGQLVIQGTAASKPLKTRGIVGSNGSESDGELHLQYGNSTDDSILFGNTGGGHITSNGTLYSGWSGGLQLPRVSKSCNFRPGINKINVEEYQNDSANLPSAHWYHIYTSEGSDSNYACQLALGMTTDAAYYRRYNNGTWTSWQSLVNTTYSIATGDNNGQIKVTPSSGSAYNVSVKGLGSAAYLTADTAASANTVVKRTGDKYIYATYYNSNISNENINSYTNDVAVMFTSNDKWIRRTSRLNFAKYLTNEQITSPGYFVTLTDSWGHFGYSTAAQTRSAIGAQAALSVSTTTTGTNGFNLRKWGNIVTIQANGVTADKRGSVPSGWRPPAVLWMGCVAFDGSKWYYGFIGINPNGTIDCKILNGTSIPAVTTSTYGFYLTGSWIL